MPEADFFKMEKQTVRLFTKSEKKILFFTGAGHFLAHSFILIFPSIITPLAAELNLPFEDVIKISFLMYLFYGLGALPSGLLTDRLQPKISLTIYFLGIGLAGFFIAFARTQLQLKLTLMILGIFLSIYHPAGIGLLSKSMKNRGLALGLNGIFGSIGIASAPFLAGTVNYFIGWRYIYRILSIPSIALGILLFSTGLYHQESDPISIKTEKEESSQKKILPFIILCGSMSLAGLVYRGQTLLLPTYFERKINFLYNFVLTLDFFKGEGTKTLSATILTSFVYMISIFGQIMGGKIADKYELRYAYLYFFLFSLPFLIMMYFLKDIPLLAASIFFIMFSIGMQPVENSLIAKFTPHKWRNTSYGVKFTLTFGISSVVIYPISFFQTRYDLSAVFLFFSLIIGILVLNNFFLILLTRGVSVRN